MTTSPAADLAAGELHVLLGEPRERDLDDAEVAQQLLDDRLDRRRARWPGGGRRSGCSRSTAVPSASMLALVSRPPVKAPSARPARSKSLIVSPCSRMIWPTSPSPGSWRWRRGEVQEVLAGTRRWRRSAPAPPYGDVEAGGRQRRGTSRAPRPAGRAARRSPGTAPGTRSRAPGRPSSPAAGERVELLLDDAGDAGPQPLEPAHRELRGQQLAQPGVVGRVGEAQPADVPGGRVAAAADVRPDVVAVRRGVREHLPGLGVAGDQPDVDARGTRSACRPARVSRSAPRRGHRVEARRASAATTSRSGTWSTLERSMGPTRRMIRSRTIVWTCPVKRAIGR